MPTLRTGFVRASGYANKVRKVLFAVARGRVEPKEIVRAAGELNQRIFEELQELGIGKEDVIRVSINFEVHDGRIEWNYRTLSIEVYRKEEEGKLAEAMEEFEEREKLLDEAIKELEKSAEDLKQALEKLLEKIEVIKQEHTALKLRVEK